MPEWSRPPGPDDRIEILLVEDDPDIIQQTEEAFETTDREIALHTVSNGYDAIYTLREQRSTESPSLPDLALVDLDVPGKDGREILETVKGDPHLRRLPVIILTSSRDSEDIARCYDAHANAYVKKPTDPGEFVSLMEAIKQFWLERAQLPPISQ